MDMRRHIEWCTNAVLPGERRRLFVGDTGVGWADVPGPGELRVADAAGLADLAAGLEAEGRFVTRRERFGVFRDGVLDPGAEPPVGAVDRGALPLLGITAFGVHLNGLVRRGDAIHLWVARRAADKRLDPGKLDHLVGGGVAAGMGFADTLAKEAQEEAGLPPELAEKAEHVGLVRYACLRAEGLRRDVLACYDLWLPEEFAPTAVDGEVAGFELWPLAEAVDRVRRTDDFKFNDNLVLIDLFLRLGVLPDDEAAALTVSMARVRVDLPSAAHIA